MLTSINWLFRSSLFENFNEMMTILLANLIEFLEKNESYFERILGESSLRRGSVADFNVTSAVDTLLG